MNKLKFLILAFALISLSNCVMANNNIDNNGGDGTGEPAISGSVSDALSKKPIKGVTISVTTSKDKVGKLVTTDASGKFIIPKLPAGEVTIVLEKKGYKTYRRERVVVKEGKEVKLNFDISNDADNEQYNLLHPLLRMIES